MKPPAALSYTSTGRWFTSLLLEQATKHRDAELNVQTVCVLFQLRQGDVCKEGDCRTSRYAGMHQWQRIVPSERRIASLREQSRQGWHHFDTRCCELGFRGLWVSRRYSLPAPPSLPTASLVMETPPRDQQCDQGGCLVGESSIRPKMAAEEVQVSST